MIRLGPLRAFVGRAEGGDWEYLLAVGDNWVYRPWRHETAQVRP